MSGGRRERGNDYSSEVVMMMVTSHVARMRMVDMFDDYFTQDQCKIEALSRLFSRSVYIKY